MIGEILGGLGSLFGYNAQKKQAQAALNEQRRLSAPGLRAQTFAVPELLKYIQQYAAPAAAEQINPLLRAQHDINVNELMSQEQQGRNAIRARGAGGNEGRYTGDLFRLAQGVGEQRAKENLGYATQQKQFNDVNRANLFSALNAIANFGQGSVAPMMSAVQANAAQQAANIDDLWSGIGASLGSILGAKYDNKFDEWVKKL